MNNNYSEGYISIQKKKIPTPTPARKVQGKIFV